MAREEPAIRGGLLHERRQNKPMADLQLGLLQNHVLSQLRQELAYPCNNASEHERRGNLRSRLRRNVRIGIFGFTISHGNPFLWQRGGLKNYPCLRFVK